MSIRLQRAVDVSLISWEVSGFLVEVVLRQGVATVLLDKNRSHIRLLVACADWVDHFLALSFHHLRVRPGEVGLHDRRNFHRITRLGNGRPVDTAQPIRHLVQISCAGSVCLHVIGSNFQLRPLGDFFELHYLLLIFDLALYNIDSQRHQLHGRDLLHPVVFVNELLFGRSVVSVNRIPPLGDLLLNSILDCLLHLLLNVAVGVLVRPFVVLRLHHRLVL